MFFPVAPRALYIFVPPADKLSLVLHLQGRDQERLRLAGALVYTADQIEAVEGYLRALMPLKATP